ncbi:MAG: PKD domain-containing protein [Bacteroidetes bacterium]|nr:MAG: PKD domain-containing protein [Bacteroidota bacterium]
MEMKITNFKRSFGRGFMRIALAFTMVMLMGLTAWAQPDYYSYNTGTSYNAFPLNSTTNKVQWIYDAGQFHSNGPTGNPAFSGLITHVYFRLGTTTNGSSVYSNFTIKLGQNVGTQSTWTSTTWATGLTTVFSQASYSMTGASPTSWYMVQLQTPFVYDPSLSLVMEISVTGGTGNQVAQYTANGSRRIWGTSAGASGSSYGTGQVDFGFDIVPLNVDVTSITFPSDICQFETTPVEVTVENTDIVARGGFLLEYKINGVSQSVETYTQQIPAGQSANFIFNVPTANLTTGPFTISANVVGKAQFVDQAYNVNGAPDGSIVSQGSTFQGAFNSGTALDPDIVAYGDQISYTISAPPGYVNSNYNSTWAFDFYEFVTANGSTAGAAHVQNNPSGNNDATVTFNPVQGLSDSTFKIRYALRETVHNCVAPVVEREIFVAPRPTAGYTSGTACENGQMKFKNNSAVTSGFITHKWYFGDGDSSTLINPSHVYANAGTYNTQLVVTTNYGYTANYTLQVDVFENPDAAFDALNVCEGNANTFTDASMIPGGTPVYEWNFGDGSTSSASSPSHQYATPGNYTVTLKVTTNGCVDQMSKEVTYAPIPVADFNFNQVDCNNDEVTFSNASTLAFGNMGYSWDFGDGTNANSNNPKHTYSSFGNINVTLVATSNFGCTHQVVKAVSLKEAPMADFTVANLCNKDNVSFTNTGSEPSGFTTAYEWSFNDGSTSNAKDYSRSFNAIGTYTVTLKAQSSNGCVDEKMVNISVDEKPVAGFVAANTCEGSDVQFNSAAYGNNGNFTHSWDFGSSMTSNLINPTQSLATGTHAVTLTVESPSGCKSTLTKNVEVFAKPVISNLVFTTLNIGDGNMGLTADITPANIPYTILWGDGNKTFGTVNGPVAEQHQYTLDGVWTADIRLNNNGCLTQTTVDANVKRTGMEHVNTTALTAYPNPARDAFKVDLSKVEGSVKQIEVLNANGQVMNVNIEMLETSADVNMNQVAAGLYLVRVQTENGIYTTRVNITR